MSLSVSTVLPQMSPGVAPADTPTGLAAELEEASLEPASESLTQTALADADALTQLAAHHPVIAGISGALLTGAALVRIGVVSHQRGMPVSQAQQNRSCLLMNGSKRETGFALVPIGNLFDRADRVASSIHLQEGVTVKHHRLWVEGAFMRGMPIMVTIADNADRAQAMLAIVNRATGHAFADIDALYQAAHANSAPGADLTLPGPNGEPMVRIHASNSVLDATAARTDGLSGQYVIGQGPYYVQIDIASHSERGMRLQLVDRLPTADIGMRASLSSLVHGVHNKGPLGRSHLDAFVCLRIQSSLQ
jgi:hypothetical protein